jgi:hypothetical protein
LPLDVSSAAQRLRCKRFLEPLGVRLPGRGRAAVSHCPRQRLSPRRNCARYSTLLLSVRWRQSDADVFQLAASVPQTLIARLHRLRNESYTTRLLSPSSSRNHSNRTAAMDCVEPRKRSGMSIMSFAGSAGTKLTRAGKLAAQRPLFGPRPPVPPPPPIFVVP